MKRSSGQASIGSMVRRIRVSEGISLADLARRAGLSQSFLSQVERGLTNPSINSLRKIAQSLGCPLSTFFEEPAPVRGPVIRKHERKVLYNTRSNLTYQLASGYPNHRIQLLITMLESGSSTLDSPMAHRGDEACLVIQGSCLFQLGEEKYELNEGDAIFIPENTPHMFTNTSDSLLIVMGAISPPDF